VLTAQHAFLAFTEEASVGVEPFYAMLRAFTGQPKHTRFAPRREEAAGKQNPEFPI
jgi:hypothetical protein